MNRELTVFGTIREAWHLTKGSKWPILGTILCGYLAIFALLVLAPLFSMLFPHAPIGLGKPGSLHALLSSTGSLISAIIYAVCIFLALLLIFGMIASVLKIAIERSRGKPVSVQLGLSALLHRLFPVLFTFILVGLILALPAIVMMIANYTPGTAAIIVYIIYAIAAVILTFLSLQFAVDKTANPFSAVMQSVRATRGYFFKLLGILIILELIGLIIRLPSMLGGLLHSHPLIILGTIFAFVAMVWFIPFQMLVFGVVYQKLVD